MIEHCEGSLCTKRSNNNKGLAVFESPGCSIFNVVRDADFKGFEHKLWPFAKRRPVTQYHPVFVTYLSLAVHRACAEHHDQSCWWTLAAVGRQTKRNADVGMQVRSRARIA